MKSSDFNKLKYKIFYTINKDYSHVQQLTEDFGPEDTLDYKFDTLIEIAEHFRMEYNEELKEGLKGNFCDKLKTLISEFKDKLEKLKYTLASVR